MKAMPQLPALVWTCSLAQFPKVGPGWFPENLYANQSQSAKKTKDEIGECVSGFQF